MGDEAKSKRAVGFLSVLSHAEHGLFGGYLVLNTAGRPLEFHCTTPIKPNRAQEILYGPTLEPFLYGEQIGQTLLEKSKVEPLFVCTDREPALAVRQHVTVPVALVLPADAGTPEQDGQVLRIDAAHPSGPVARHAGARWPRRVEFQLGRNRLAVLDEVEEDQRLIQQRFADLADWFDLAEPFARIREAIEEAQQAVR